MAKEQPQGLALRRNLESLRLELSTRELMQIGGFLDMVLERNFIIKHKKMEQFLIKLIFFLPLVSIMVKVAPAMPQTFPWQKGTILFFP